MINEKELKMHLERFGSVYDFHNAITTRNNSEAMGDEHDSKMNGSWSGTQTWDEAEGLLEKGWDAKVEELKNILDSFSNTIERTRVKHKPNMAGFAPIIPAAVKGVPKSMWSINPKKKIEKTNYMHIYFNIHSSGGVDADDLMKAGLAVLKLCILFEKNGIRTQIDILPFTSMENVTILGCAVKIKNFREPFNLQKMAYPIAHVSMFRRQGFRWLETYPENKESGFRSGYGTPLSRRPEYEKVYKEKFGLNESGSIYITYYECQANEFDPVKIAKAKGIEL